MDIRREGIPIAGRAHRPVLDMRGQPRQRVDVWRYTGPFAGSISDTDKLTIKDGPYSFGDTSGLLTAGDEVVDLSAHTGVTVYVYMHLRYGMTVKYELLSSTTRPAANGSDDLFADIVLGVAVVNADSYITSWYQEQYGPIHVEKYCGAFGARIKAADLATMEIIRGYVYHGTTHLDRNADSIAPGASRDGYIYYTFTYDASNVIQVTLTSNDSVSPPSGAADTLIVVLGAYSTDGSGYFTRWEQWHHGNIDVNNWETYDPTGVAGTVNYAAGHHPPQLIEATGITGSADLTAGHADNTLDYRKGAVWQKT